MWGILHGMFIWGVHDTFFCSWAKPVLVTVLVEVDDQRWLITVKMACKVDVLIQVLYMILTLSFLWELYNAKKLNMCLKCDVFEFRKIRNILE